MPSPTIGAYSAATITLSSLANNAARESTAIDLSGSQPHDVMVAGSLRTASGSLSVTTPYAIIYAYAKIDGTNYTGGATGSNAAYTVPTEMQMHIVDIIRFHAADTQVNFGPISLARIFGGQIPPEVGFVVQNLSGLGLHASSGNALNYRTVTY